MNTQIIKDEIARVNAIYSERKFDFDCNYSGLNPAYLQRTQSIEKHILITLNKTGVGSRISSLNILDFGCGKGKWLARWIAWGADPSKLAGVDIRKDATSYASSILPHCDIRLMDSLDIPYQNDTYDIVFINSVFTSILNENVRMFVASEINRVLKPHGIIMLSDFIYNNPRNPNVRGLTYKHITRVFKDMTIVTNSRIILAPPIARRLVPVSWKLSKFVEAAFSFLKTHRFVALRKEQSIEPIAVRPVQGRDGHYF